MLEDSTLHAEAFFLLQNQISDLFFILSDTGIIEKANVAAERLTGRHLIGMKFLDILAYFEGTLALDNVSATPEPERILNIKSNSDLPQSYYFSFKKIADCILVFGRLDSEEIEKSRSELFSLNQELNNLSRQLHKKNAQLSSALSQIKTLRGILPICSHCHKIRNDREIWDKLETYIENQTKAQFSHSICPECLNKHYPDFPDDPEE